jgi:hypothetical protein
MLAAWISRRGALMTTSEVEETFKSTAVLVRDRLLC